MSAPITSSSPSVQSAAVPANILGKSPASGLFGNILMSNFPTSVTSSAPEEKSGQLFGKSGLNLNPAMLVLPQELASMTNEELMKFLSSTANTNDGGLNDTILRSLTPGIPIKDAMAYGDLNRDVFSLPAIPPDQLSINGDAALRNNLLLAATGINITDIDTLKSFSETIIKNATLEKETLTLDADEITSSSMAMVVFVTPMIVNQPEKKSADFNLKLDAQSNGQLGTLSNNYASIFDSDTNPLNTLSLDTVSGNPSNEGFKGSINSLLGSKSAEGQNDKLISGQTTPTPSQLGQAMLTASGLSHPHLIDGNYLLSNLQGMDSLQSPFINPLLTSSAASSGHPSLHVVAMMIEKATTGSDKAKQELSVQLDPPELGRMQIQLSIEKGGAMKVHLTAEKQDALNLIQRDSHILKSALENAGIKLDNASLTFDLASGDQSFNQLLGGQQQDQSSKGHTNHFILNKDGSIINDSQMRQIDTKLDFIPDGVTGNIHYSLLV